MVTYFYDQLFLQHNLAVIDACVGPVYIQHNAGSPTGTDVLRAIGSQPPGGKHAIVRVIGQGDLVLIQQSLRSGNRWAGHCPHGRVPGQPGQDRRALGRDPAGTATTASGNDMFSTVSTSGEQSTQRTERIVLSYYTKPDRETRSAGVDRFVSPSLIQHDPALPNGSAAVKAAFAARLQANPQLTFSKLQVIADHDLVSLRYHVQNSPTDLGQAVDDVYRVAKGQDRRTLERRAERAGDIGQQQHDVLDTRRRFVIRASRRCGRCGWRRSGCGRRPC